MDSQTKLIRAEDVDLVKTDVFLGLDGELTQAHSLNPDLDQDLILDQNIWMLGQNRMMYRMDEGDNPRIIRLANQHSATYDGHIRRSNGKLRPFILTRSFYAGSQRTAAVWTGDNTADWGHLRISVPMVLSHSIVGITHIGADVGGFFLSPDEFLLTRWYQAAAYTSFYRAHAHIDTKRREPWLFGSTALNIIRESLRAHYRLLPYLYTLFYENELTGAPPMRPLWVEFPSDEATFAIDNEYLLGPSLLIRPVVEEGATSATVYFPHGSWFDVDDYTTYSGPNSITVEAPREKIPVYQRGGSIIPRKMRARRSSALMIDDPYTLFVALDLDGKSRGTLYMDDEHTFDYRDGKFVFLNFTFEGNVLSSKVIDPKGNYQPKSWLERIIIIGIHSQPSKVTIHSGSKVTTLEFTTEKKKDTSAEILTIRKPGINMAEEFTLTLH